MYRTRGAENCWRGEKREITRTCEGRARSRRSTYRHTVPANSSRLLVNSATKRAKQPPSVLWPSVPPRESIFSPQIYPNVKIRDEHCETQYANLGKFAQFLRVSSRAYNCVNDATTICKGRFATFLIYCAPWNRQISENRRNRVNAVILLYLIFSVFSSLEFFLIIVRWFIRIEMRANLSNILFNQCKLA